MLTSSFPITATEQVLPRLELDFTKGSLDSRITFTRALNTATRVNASGLVEVVNADTARFDYDPITLACKGLLVEESRTNLTTYSEAFENAAWQRYNSPTVTTNATTAPDGTSTADVLVEPSQESYMPVLFRGGLTDGAVYTLSVYAKKANRDWLFLGFNYYPVTGAYFNLNTGALGSKGAQITSHSIQPAGNGWYRCTITWTANSAGEYMIGGALSDGFYYGTWTGVQSVYIWGAQAEAGAFATSYIPATAGTAVTRNADVAKMTGASFSDWWRSGPNGVVSRWIPSTVSGTRPVVEFDDNTADNAVCLRGNTTNPELYIRAGGSDQAQIDAGTIAANTANKLAASWAANSCAASNNSGAPGLDGTATLPTVTQARLGSDGTNYLNGHLQSIEYYGEQFTPANLQVLSSAAGYRSIIRSLINPIL